MAPGAGVIFPVANAGGTTTFRFPTGACSCGTGDRCPHSPWSGTNATSTPVLLAPLPRRRRPSLPPIEPERAPSSFRGTPTRWLFGCRSGVRAERST
jgi:hypothetical protein